ncbi:hypothetical protein Glove_330g104 [Diversispora epigaea]|uniref:Zinc-ribbon domain-containing protein n=1 Tax=Diversispora epigaea TaxID=1348612 RepID=A0A397HMW2_9GLOM|nr:hypothetical protein Glove_330g104 [Diversispora epigaea]
MAKSTLDIAREIACNREGKCLSEKYINSKVPMLWKRAKDYLWSASLNCVKNRKTWCPRCAVENQRTRTIEDMKKFAIKKGANSIAQEQDGKCISTEYVNANTPMFWRCAKGHEWSTTLYRIKNMGRWCPQCSGNFLCGLIEAKEIAHSRGANSIAQEQDGKCISTEYVNANTPMFWRCAKGHEWSTTLYRIKNMGRWCPQCSGNFLCGLIEAKEIAHSRGGYTCCPNPK